jgi:hypothetical protein
MKLYPILFEQFNNKETYPNFSEQDVELEGTASDFVRFSPEAIEAYNKTLLEK